MENSVLSVHVSRIHWYVDFRDVGGIQERVGCFLNEASRWLLYLENGNSSYSVGL
jgi:hypothetical protein